MTYAILYFNFEDMDIIEQKSFGVEMIRNKYE